MTAVILVLAVLAVAGWLCLSPVRLAVAGAVLLITHPVPTVALTAVAALGVTVAGVRLVYRSLSEGGWYLVTVQRPAYATSRAGGIAS
ncbi:hypothetical protein AB0C87_30720 [Actinomadura sp. NPDC048021]|uniref:hypothetical protein n=1 Tax=Actinomadura sp. NPDC048021 TaxID=3155385 RepID=UPI0033F3D744